ncbi:hypothetical protein AALA98_16075 [Lachnospiraceae bacterium 45-W7]
MSIKIPLCEFCRNFNIYEDRTIKCKAFPDGIPIEKICLEEGEAEECANGIGFEENTDG